MYESVYHITDKKTPKIIDCDDDNEKSIEVETATQDLVADTDGVRDPQILPLVRPLPSVRKTGNFVIPFIRHARSRVSTRDLLGRAPLHPRGGVLKPDLPEEMDPAWLKDKGDTSLTQGDYLVRKKRIHAQWKEGGRRATILVGKATYALTCTTEKARA